MRWVIFAKPRFLHSLDILIKMFANSLAALSKLTLGRTDLFIACKHS